MSTFAGNNQATRSKCRYFLNLVLDTALQNKLASLVDAIASSKGLETIID